jgi:hypothetical protein
MKSLRENTHALEVVGKPKDLQLIWCRDQVGKAEAARLSIAWNGSSMKRCHSTSRA